MLVRGEEGAGSDSVAPIFQRNQPFGKHDEGLSRYGD